MSTQVLTSTSTPAHSRLPVRSSGPLPAADRAPTTMGPRSAAYRVAYRLTGSSRRSSAVADDAVGAAAAAEDAATGPPAIAVAVDAALATVLATADAVIAADLDHDPYAQHRKRLRRELARWPRRERVTLALRHLVGMTPELIGDVVKWDESAVRDITRHWVPDDSALATAIDLRDYGRLFGQVRSAEPDPTTADPLDHLDRPVA